ncbi:uncharacterized protein LOC129594852 [Paramacrobiotus metropolitanus]|uniref:uncharacterized protein LOC129594852 n=1 Tax=Paramacrobiotus metropolitanus TaxID=2943436 RepID=UPI0024459A4A|nr:uncharacterized protein LOC129594852 [Paramacrobiotus metropolitanus]
MFFNTSDSLKVSVVHNFSLETQNAYDPSLWRRSVPWSGNFTWAQRDQANIMSIVLYPLLLTACTIGNVLNLIVLISSKRQKTTNSYMIAVAVADIIVLWMFVPLYLWNTGETLNLTYINPGKPGTRRDGTTVRRSPPPCRSNTHCVERVNKKTFSVVSAMLPYTILTQETFIHVCDWVLIAFSLERLLAIARPFTFKWVQRATTARTAISVLILFSAAFSSGNFLSQWYLWRYDLETATLPVWLKNWTKTQDVAEVVVSFLKFFGLLCINVLVIGVVNRQQRSDIGQQRAAQDVNSAQRSRTSNQLLLGSVTLYLITLFPSLVYKFLEMADTYAVYNFDPSAKSFAAPFCDVTMLTNYSVNFFLYLTVSENYRVQFMRLFGGVMCPTWLKRNWSKYADSSWNNSHQRSWLHGNVKEKLECCSTVRS